MTGESQTAKVQASRVLMDALADPTSFEERDFRATIAREIDAKAAAASAKIEELVLRVVVGIVRDELEHLPGWVVTLAGNLTPTCRRASASCASSGSISRPSSAR
jgi:hypothetical protein